MRIFMHLSCKCSTFLRGLILVLLQVFRVPKFMKREVFTNAASVGSALVAKVLTLLLVEDLRVEETQWAVGFPWLLSTVSGFVRV